MTTKQRELKEFCCTLCKQPRVSLEGGGHWLRLQGYKNLHGTFSFSFPSEIIAVDVIPSNFQSYLLVYGFVSIAIWQSGQPIWNSTFLFNLAHSMLGNWKKYVCNICQSLIIQIWLKYWKWMLLYYYCSALFSAIFQFWSLMCCPIYLTSSLWLFGNLFFF